jgi:hypothetical protein
MFMEQELKKYLGIKDAAARGELGGKKLGA